MTEMLPRDRHLAVRLRTMGRSQVRCSATCTLGTAATSEGTVATNADTTAEAPEHRWDAAPAGHLTERLDRGQLKLASEPARSTDVTTARYSAEYHA